MTSEKKESFQDVVPLLDMAVRISPQSKVLPANILRFYLHFSRPAEAHFERDHLLLLNEKDQVVPEPFLVLSQELWSLDGRRLTVLMEPGRIKRGLGADPAHAPAFVIGQTNSLRIEVLGHTEQHVFRVSDPVLTAIDEFRWRLISPDPGSLNPVVLHFDRVMDAVLCEDEIKVFLHTGEVVQTHVLLAPDGNTAHLTPSHPWRVAEHHLVVSERFEDICGNRLGESLDHDLVAEARPRFGIIKFTPGSELKRLPR